MDVYSIHDEHSVLGGFCWGHNRKIEGKGQDIKNGQKNFGASLVPLDRPFRCRGAGCPAELRKGGNLI